MATSVRRLSLGDPIVVGVGQELAIVLSSDGDFGLFQGPPGDSYAGGEALSRARPNPPGWACMCDFWDARLDLPFATLVDTPAPVPWPAGWLAVGIAALAVTRTGMRRRAG
ncbi:MAG: hypothetical protein HY953_07775 [Candidatus Rokubacteria bacterium]|nr:hypothetical protein [Candidatus Rokubacteria bacterium]